MKRALGMVFKYFLRGLLVVAPLALTLWILWEIFVLVDDLLPLPEYVARGVGFVIVVTLVIAVGVLTSNWLAARALELSERLFTRLPFVKLLYSSIKDLTGAFVGEKRRFDRPVLLAVGSELAVIGFVTSEDVGHLGLPGGVAVYVPQSYNFAGNLLVVPRERVRAIERPAGEVLAFVVSGGLTAARDPGRESKELQRESPPRR